MNAITIVLISIVVLGGAYLLYGKWLVKKWGIDPEAQTPAYAFEDGVDYVPADRGVVFGHQFASIAGAGPINGPIQAAIFGWLPVLLWILIGGVFIGAVQDFSAMYASVRNKGRSIGYIIECYIGKTGKKLFLLFCWLFCILVVAAFVDIVAGTFNGMTTSAEGVVSNNAANGSVASTSILFIVEAVALGLILRFAKLSKWINTIIAILFLVVAIVVGLNVPIFIGQDIWRVLVFLYVMLASVVPIWLLLQPRDYLNSYLLVVMMAAAVIGVFLANPTMNLPTFTGFNINGQSLFPFMFVTVACGAVSGFHSLVSSGTSSKQLKNERDMLPVSFGSMLLECLLGVIALVAVGSFATGVAKAQGFVTPPQVFAGAISGFLSALHLPQNIVFTVINLAVSAFALTSLDSVARVGRLSFQELFHSDHASEQTALTRFLTNKYTATLATLFFAYLLTRAGYSAIWPLFGSANQLLSVLSFIACAVFLKRTKRMHRVLYVPIIVMMSVTFTALIIKIVQLCTQWGEATNQIIKNDVAVTFVFADGLQLVFAILVFGLGVCVAWQGIRSLFFTSTAATSAPSNA